MSRLASNILNLWSIYLLRLFDLILIFALTCWKRPCLWVFVLHVWIQVHDFLGLLMRYFYVVVKFMLPRVRVVIKTYERRAIIEKLSWFLLSIFSSNPEKAIVKRSLSFDKIIMESEMLATSKLFREGGPIVHHCGV